MEEARAWKRKDEEGDQYRKKETVVFIYIYFTNLLYVKYNVDHGQKIRFWPLMQTTGVFLFLLYISFFSMNSF